jgi:methyl-accepting chemotaxis protein
MRLLLSTVFGILTSVLPIIEANAQFVGTEIQTSPHFGPDAHAALGAYRGMVEEHTEGIQRTLRVIADSTEAKSGKEAQFKPMLMRLSDNLSTDATAWFVFPDGSYFATEAAGMTDQNLKDRPYFSVLMSGKESFGDLVISKSTGHRSVVIAVPVSSEGKVVGAVGVSLRVRLLSELVDQHMSLPATSYFYALEQDTRIVLHRKAERMFQTPSDVGDEALGEEFKRVLKQDRGTFEYTLQGKKISAIYERSPALGWYFFIAREVGA